MQTLLPDTSTAFAVLVSALVVASAAAALAGWLRTRRGVRAPYTRKLFHFIIISVALFVQLRWSFAGTALYSLVVVAAVLYAVWRGAGSAFYEAIARPTDAPHEKRFILVPLATTALGGLLTNLLVPAWAHVGYFVVAWGDAVGEPVGTRWGKHRYQVPSLFGVPATRSVEGSAAVAAVAIVAAFSAIALGGVPPSESVLPAVIIGLSTAAVEAVSHHGLDNLTIQLVAAVLASVLLH